MPTGRNLAQALALSVLLAACGDDASKPWTFEDDVAEQAPCTTDAECGEGSYCHVPSDCEAPTHCEDGFPPYSAAPPYLACSCGGTITSVNAGYPGRHAWSASGVYDTSSLSGDSCDADAVFPVAYALDITINSEIPEGLLGRISAQGNNIELLIPTDGALAAEIEAGPWPDLNYIFLNDLDGDGACGPDDEVFLGIESFREVDLSAFELRAEVVLQLFEDGCSRW